MKYFGPGVKYFGSGLKYFGQGMKYFGVKDLIDPGVSVESDGKADGKENTGVPVNEDEDIEDHFGDPESIREVGPRLSLVEELKHSVDSRHPVQSEDDRAGHLDKAPHISIRIVN